MNQSWFEILKKKKRLWLSAQTLWPCSLWNVTPSNGPKSHCSCWRAVHAVGLSKVEFPPKSTWQQHDHCDLQHAACVQLDWVWQCRVFSCVCVCVCLDEIVRVCVCACLWLGLGVSSYNVRRVLGRRAGISPHSVSGDINMLHDADIPNE